MTFAANRAGTAECIAAFSGKLGRMRAARQQGDDAIVEFDDDDRDKAMSD
jgi:hypothetical protein